MTLDQFLDMEGAPAAAEFAAAVGVSEASISRIRKGEQNVTRDLMRRIIAASGQRVTADALVGVHVLEDGAQGAGASATNSADNIGAPAGVGQAPFSATEAATEPFAPKRPPGPSLTASSPTCSTTSAHPRLPLDSPGFSTSERPPDARSQSSTGPEAKAA